MSVEDHIKSVDWSRVHKKHKELEKVKEDLKMAILMAPLFLLVSKTNPLIPFIMVSITAIYLAYLGYDYLKWSRYDVMRTPEVNPKEGTVL